MAANDLPSNVSYGTVTGRFLLAYADGIDANLFPDGVPAKGTILFTPSAANVKNLAASPAPVTILPATLSCDLDNEGYLIGPDGNRGVRLVATDDPDNNPVDWTWRVDYRLTDQSDVPTRGIATHSMELPGGSTIDLTAVAPVAEANGVYTIVGPQGAQGIDGRFEISATPPENPTEGDGWFNSTNGKMFIWYDSYWVEAYANLVGPQGPQGPAGVSLAIGTVTTGAPGTNAQVILNTVGSTQYISFVIPRGDVGATGATGATGPKGDIGDSLSPFLLVSI